MDIDVEIKDYIKKTKNLFKILEIDTIRDGGTVHISGSHDNNFYVHHTKNTIHTIYPPDSKNKVTEKGLLKFIKVLLDDYIKRKKQEVKQLIHIQNKINNK